MIFCLVFGTLTNHNYREKGKRERKRERKGKSIDAFGNMRSRLVVSED